MLLINCDINFILTWSGNRVISEGNRITTFTITDTELYILVATLSTLDNTKLLQQLKSGFKSNNRESKPTFRLLNWTKFSGSK